MNCDDSAPLVANLCGVASERKLRLFGVACCRRIERAVLPDRVNDARHVIDVAERFADGDGTPDDLMDADWRGEFCTGSDQRQPFMRLVSAPKSTAINCVADEAFNEVIRWERERLNPLEDEEDIAEWRRVVVTEKAAQYALLRYCR
jgi:hypothetical protein